MKELQEQRKGGEMQGWGYWGGDWEWGGEKKEERKKYETKEKENEVRVGRHLLRYLAFSFILIFLHTVSLPHHPHPHPPVSPSSLRHSAILSNFFRSHPTFLVSSLRARVTGFVPWAEACAHPESSPLPPISHPKETDTWDPDLSSSQSPLGPGRALQTSSVSSTHLECFCGHISPLYLPPTRRGTETKEATQNCQVCPLKKFQRREEGCDYFTVYLGCFYWRALGISVLPLEVAGSSVPLKDLFVHKFPTHFLNFSGVCS